MVLGCCGVGTPVLSLPLHPPAAHAADLTLLLLLTRLWFCAHDRKKHQESSNRPAELRPPPPPPPTSPSCRSAAKHMPTWIIEPTETLRKHFPDFSTPLRPVERNPIRFIDHLSTAVLSLSRTRARASAQAAMSERSVCSKAGQRGD